jgi:hypothetical protein
LDEAVCVRSSFGEGSDALIVDALSTEATLVSLSLLLSEMSEGVVLFDKALGFFGSSGRRTGSRLVLMGSGWGECLSLCDLVNFENNPLFSDFEEVSLRDEGAGLALRARAVEEFIGVLVWGVLR